jgi:streptogramin lyase
VRVSGVFISYRREDCPGHAGWLYDCLAEDLGRDRVFMDVNSIEAGVDFSERLGEAVGACSLLIALIGSGWLDARDEAGRRRLDDPEDFVHQELAAGLARSGLRVIPVLVEGATMPRAEDLPDDLKALARRHARELSHARWDYDAGRLIDAARLSGAAPSRHRPAGAATSAGGRAIVPAARWLARGGWRVVAPAAVVAALVVAVVVLLSGGEGHARAAVLTLAIGKTPARLTVGGGFVWVPLGPEGVVARVDPRSLAVKRIGGFARDPFAASVDADGKIGGIWVTDSGAAQVVRIDPVTSRRGKPIDVTPDPNDIAVGEGFVWTADGNFDAPPRARFYVSRIDPKSRAVKQIDIGARPAGIGTGAGYAWVSSVAGSVQTIAPRSGAIVGTPIAVGDDLEDVVADDASVWVAVKGSGEVAHIDPRTRTVDVRIAVGFEPVTLATGGGFLWVIDARDGMLRRVSLRSRSVVGTPLRVDRFGFGVAYGEGRAWATASRDSGFGSPGTLKGFAP